MARCITSWREVEGKRRRALDSINNLVHLGWDKGKIREAGLFLELWEAEAHACDNYRLHNLILEWHQLGRKRLPSHRPFSRHAAALHGSGHNTLQSWRPIWQQTVNPHTKLSLGADLPRKDWVTLSRLQTGVGRFNANMYRWNGWGLRPSAACTCGAKEQTAEHIIYERPTLRPPRPPTWKCRPDNPQPHYSKTLYIGSRWFLPTDSTLRKDEHRGRPAQQIREEQVALGREIEALPPSKRWKKAAVVEKKGVELISKLQTYEYLQYPVEAMHTIQV